MPAPHPRRILPRSRRWPGLNRPSQGSEATAIYGVTAVRYREDEIEQLMLGLIDPEMNIWALKPSPARLIEVVDRLLGGDEVKIVKYAAGGRLLCGPALRVKMLDSGAETLEAVNDAATGHSLRDLPRF